MVGPTSQQDTEITALFKDSVTIYGESEVLGMLAYREEEVHYMYKREANEEPTTTAITPTDEPTETNFIYRAPGEISYFYTPTCRIVGHCQGIIVNIFENSVYIAYIIASCFPSSNMWS